LHASGLVTGFRVAGIVNYADGLGIGVIVGDKLLDARELMASRQVFCIIRFVYPGVDTRNRKWVERVRQVRVAK